MTSDDLRLVLQGGGTLLMLGVGVLTWSLKRNAKSNDDTLAEIAKNVRSLAGKVEGHTTSLAVGNEKFRQIEVRVQGLEDRERERWEAAGHTHRRHTDPVPK